MVQILSQHYIVTISGHVMSLVTWS